MLLYTVHSAKNLQVQYNLVNVRSRKLFIHALQKDCKLSPIVSAIIKHIMEKKTQNSFQK